MNKSLACGDLIPGCKAVLSGKDEKEVMERTVAHAKKAHDMPTVSAEMEAKAKAAIKDKN